MNQLIAHELSRVGFQTRIIGNSVLVSLKNRKPSKMEVEAALSQIFDEIQFDCRSTFNGVFVS